MSETVNTIPSNLKTLFEKIESNIWKKTAIASGHRLWVEIAKSVGDVNGKTWYEHLNNPTFARFLFRRMMDILFVLAPAEDQQYGSTLDCALAFYFLVLTSSNPTMAELALRVGWFNNQNPRMHWFPVIGRKWAENQQSLDDIKKIDDLPHDMVMD